MDPMSATVRAIFYTLALVCFVVAFFAFAAPEGRGGRARALNWVAAGLGFFVFVFAWDAWAVA